MFTYLDIICLLSNVSPSDPKRLTTAAPINPRPVIDGTSGPRGTTIVAVFISVDCRNHTSRANN